ncbi:hypothetical protein HWD35_11240 [Tsukamurella tyrosinosolvens]|uniref:hypothetical protein n=1 Tax=Tsukamurella tyrosinosolvens TaxID=57704 RepID=UPI00079CB3F5|nr:hypothetical protein [Tsukamurella tyrosinosolvens]AUN41470.1 hypothetical protein ASU32_16850 [Tsukamurella tyrosinosolvens]KXP04805.1 hypothetical protein AXK59_15655 [Tsukamurella tyrosinosolvens]KZL98059.1 hypothetical protein AXX05_03850 [Tsukamurella tyrosinosolvens]MCA4995285.1 hypothetical protein [Tsukamurella tyrosinosolvens]
MNSVVYIPLIVIPLFALAVAWKQLTLSQTTTGGYGLTIGARRIERVPGVTAVGVARDDQWNAVEFRIVARGPGTWFDVVGTVLRSDGQDVVVDRVPRLDNTTEAVTATAQIRTRDLDTSWFVVDWLAPRGAGIRREAYRIRVRGTGTSPSHARRRALPSHAAVAPLLDDEAFAVPDLEEWRWDRTWKARYWLWSLLPVRWEYMQAASGWTGRLGRRWLQAGRWEPVHPREPVRTGWMPGVPGGGSGR